MEQTQAGPVCVRCGRVVRMNARAYDVFEGMHYVCFHYEFEHDPYDPDEECAAGGCPAASGGRNKDQVLAVLDQLCAEWSRGEPANWDNTTLPQYLVALTAWLRNSESYYGSRGVPMPWSSWNVMATALRAATLYE